LPLDIKRLALPNRFVQQMYKNHGSVELICKHDCRFYIHVRHIPWSTCSILIPFSPT